MDNKKLALNYSPNKKLQGIEPDHICFDDIFKGLKIIPKQNGYEIYKLNNQVKLRELKDALANKQHEYELLVSNVSRKRAEINRIKKQIKKLLSD